MATLASTLASAVVAFAATNVDDITVLLAFFAESVSGKSEMKTAHVFLGQYVGFIILVAISLAGYAVSYFLPGGLIGFLGFVPLGMGLKWLYDLIKEHIEARRSEDTGDTIVELPSVGGVQNVESVEPNISSTLENGGVLDMVMESVEPNSSGSLENGAEHQTTEEPRLILQETEPVSHLSIAIHEAETGTDGQDSRFGRFKMSMHKVLSRIISPQTLKVTGATLGNGGDNVGIYIPLFAQTAGWEIAVTVGIFLIMLFIWCFAAYLLVSRPFVLKFFEKYGRYIVPFILIGLGLYIIINSHCFPWLAQVIRNKQWGDYDG
eukprot:TRINITY_DN32230_c0_g1_i1.p1 TRINITY_DN32230_c0_g1~~TRINITY_DN32230_c0_g1_i1.p1  ORF type:complete len:321 (+),score=-19.61 TRINITY_DN32230_c0_g1_i1:161-1123(+)